MAQNQDKINILLNKLESLLQRQEHFAKEIDVLRGEINRLKDPETSSPVEKKPQTAHRVNEKTLTGAESNSSRVDRQEKSTSRISNKPPSAKSLLPAMKSDLERFIGENLINKIGIAITVIGVAIGAKYAIDNQMISPLTRIIFGYIFGAGLLFTAYRLKRNYENFSAVLLSGSMAILYFITYAAYSFYGLMPQVLTFILMVIFTVFTVLAAINYNRQVIAHIGLVGAYAVPMLLSDDSGRVAILFSYMAIINTGILILAVKKYWKPLYYSSFLITWLIYFLWYMSDYQTAEHFILAFVFLSVFFGIFYGTFLAYKLLQKEKFEKDDVMLLLANSFIFFGFGYSLLSNHDKGEQLLGVFTLLNAIVHFLVSIIIYRKKAVDKNLLYLISGLVLVFITIAIPVQLDGNWVTLIWAGESALLFWIGRTKSVSFYEKLSYPLVLIAFLSLIHDWVNYDIYISYKSETGLTPVFNTNFLTSLICIAAFSFINILNYKTKHSSPLLSQNILLTIISYSLPVILLLTVYYTFRLEIANYWQQLYADSLVSITREDQSYPDTYQNSDLIKYKDMWIINYSMLFLIILSIFNIRKLKDQQLGLVNLGLNVLAVAVFLIQGLYVLSELRESYLEQTFSQYYNRSAFSIMIRYVSYVFVAGLLFITAKYIRQDFIKNKYRHMFDLLLHITVLWIASSELINWMDIADSKQSYKIGLSILWGSYALFLIALGIWKKKKNLRIGAIALFSITLVKLFVYDISHLDTIAKTIVFVSLGILLLIISFLYNKYKHIISDESTT